MKQLFKKLYYSLPFSIRFFIKKNFIKRIDEVEIIFELLKNKKGLMIDVGAHYGTSLKSFMDNEWEIHAFEPDPKNRIQLLKIIEGKTNVHVSQEAVTEKSGLELAFYSSEVSTGISGLSSFHPSHKEVTKVKTITLKDYINNTKIKAIDFLKIDTEGFDFFVLKGFDWEKHPHPDYIICEFEDKKTNKLGYLAKDLYDFLVSNNYYVQISEWVPIAEYGQNHKWKQFTKKIDELNDNSWGNFIATKLK